MASLNIAPKNSILKRPIRKAAGRANETSADKQWELEQQKLERLKAKRQQLAHIRGTMLFGTKQEKAEIYDKEKDCIQNHENLKQLKKANDKQEDKIIAQQMKTHYDALNRADKAQDEARKHYNQQLLDENKKLSEYRQQLKLERKQKEIEQDRQLSLEFDERWKQNAF